LRNRSLARKSLSPIEERGRKEQDDMLRCDKGASGEKDMPGDRMVTHPYSRRKQK